MPSDDSTVPRAGTRDTGLHPDEVPDWALVRVWSQTEPHRLAETGFCAQDKRMILGRGTDRLDGRMMFWPHRPGVALRKPSIAGCLTNPSVARDELALTAKAGWLEMEVLGSGKTLVNGVETRSARLGQNDLIWLEGAEMFLCVRKPRMLPLAPGWGELHPFGEPDESNGVGESWQKWIDCLAIAAAAASGAPVIVWGESGAGKEHTAASIHARSKWRMGSFVPVNCATLKGELVVNAFMGNIKNFPNPGMPLVLGLFTRARHGTLFFDEVRDLDPAVQAMLLRALDAKGDYEIQGEGVTRKVEVRVIAATNLDLSVMRPEFLYRYPGDPVFVSPLRARREDIPLLFRHLLFEQIKKDPAAERFLQEGPDGRTYPRVSGTLMARIMRDPLPGNTRSLESFLHTAIAKSRGDVLRIPVSVKELLPGSGVPASSGPSVAPAPSQRGKKPLKADFLAVWTQENGNVKAVARRFEVERGTIYQWMKEFGITRKDKPEEEPPPR